MLLVDMHEALTDNTKINDLVAVWAPPPEDFELISASIKAATPPPHD